MSIRRLWSFLVVTKEEVKVTSLPYLDHKYKTDKNGSQSNFSCQSGNIIRRGYRTLTVGCSCWISGRFPGPAEWITDQTPQRHEGCDGTIADVGQSLSG